MDSVYDTLASPSCFFQMLLSVPYICLVATALYDVINACSVPHGWTSMKVPERLKMADLVILGRFQNITHHPRGGLIIDVALHTDVKCVLKNTNHLSLDPTITIWDETTEDHTPIGGMCFNNLYRIIRDVDVIVMLHTRSYSDADDTRLRFENINMQTPYVYANETDLNATRKATNSTSACQELGVLDVPTRQILVEQSNRTLVEQSNRAGGMAASSFITIMTISVGLFVCN